MRSRYHQKAQLNPYVVVADVAIAILMVVVVSCVMSVSADQAVYENDQMVFQKVAQESGLGNDWRKHQPRVDDGLFFQFNPSDFILANPQTDAKGVKTFITPTASTKLNEIGRLITDSRCRKLVNGVTLTVTFDANQNHSGIQAEADALGLVLKNSGVPEKILTINGRTQRTPTDTSVTKATDLQSFDVNTIDICINLVKASGI